MIKYHILTKEDKYIIICSDGVWEFLSNEEVLDITLPFYNNNDPEGMCNALVNKSIIQWTREDEVIDDITAVAIFL